MQFMRKLCLALALLGMAFYVSAQKNGSVKGLVYDTLAKQPVSSATISVLDSKDSSLVSFSLTDNAGKFELKGIPNGQYRLMISHVNYHNSNTPFAISDENKSPDLGNITLNDKSRVLAEVVVTNEAPPVTLEGDTVVYNAGSFKTVPNANVEQLLKKLPGIKVDKDGTITAQGEKVTRVLVDGKEFFGNDPKIATRNLPADAVDKVQAYDKQSDQAQLTGFDDGNYEKTINLKLKKDKKKGMFGKASAGVGNKERYDGKFNVNSFKGARQMSAIGMGNNTNAEGFSFMDILSFSGQSGGNMSGNLSQSDASSGAGGNRNGGINTAWGGGLNYNNLIGNKLDWQSNYFYNRYNPYTTSHIFRENFLPGTSNFTDESSSSDNTNNSHRFNINALYQIDSFHSIRFIPSFSYQKTSNSSTSNSRTTSAKGELINEGFSDNESESEGYNFRNEISFRKKFRSRKGRTFSFTLQNTKNESDGDGSLQSIIGYYANGGLNRRDTLNQVSNSKGDLNGYSVRAIYTEPLWRRSLMEFSAGKSNTTNTNSKTTYDYNRFNGKYDKINQQQTNDFENTYGYTYAGFRVRTVRRKYNYSLGVNWQQAELEGKIISGIKDSIITKIFRNFLPTANFRYNFSGFKYLTLNYSGSTSQPTMAQLQPVPEVTNPIWVKEGNPDLKQEYRHSFRANLNLATPYKHKNLFLFLNGTITENKIVNYDLVDPATAKRITRPVNVNGVYNLSGNISYSMPVRFLKGSMELSNYVSYNKGKQFVNTIGNTIKTLSMGPQIRFDMNPYNKLNLSASARYNYNITRYSLESAVNNKYISQEYEGSADWQLPRNFFLSTDFTYTINSQRAAGFNLEIPLWNASISKLFLKNNRGQLKLTATDLLNRNTGVSRDVSQNYIEDKEVNTLRRFFMLTFTYNLNKFALNNGSGAGGMRMITR
jgi:hypothetical protein